MSPPDFIVAIPARYAASRLPGKPLRLIAGEPMIVHVARRALDAGARQVVVATDDSRIAEALSAFPVTVCMTACSHVSGTDRLAECSTILGWTAQQIVINLQGDEPFAPPEGIVAVARTLVHSGAEMATLAEPFRDCATVFDINAVKVVRDNRGFAMYFSRAALPWLRDRFAADRLSQLPAGFLRHIGIYAYRAGFLATFTQLAPSWTERCEGLEQLRVLEAGHRIAVGLSPVEFPAGVDTEADLQRAQARFDQSASGPESA